MARASAATRFLRGGRDLAFPEAQHRAVELPRTTSCAIEFWPVLDPSLAEGSREMRLDTYRALRDDLLARLTRRFPPRGAAVMG